MADYSVRDLKVPHKSANHFNIIYAYMAEVCEDLFNGQTAIRVVNVTIITFYALLVYLGVLIITKCLQNQQHTFF